MEAATLRADPRHGVIGERGRLAVRAEVPDSPMSLSIRLLGRPSIPAADENGEQPRMSGGQKPWALLAYLLLIPEGATRRDLAERIPVGSALRLGSDVGAVLIHDAPQAKAARAAGLSVEMPGASQA